MNEIILGDAYKLIKDIPDKSVDLRTGEPYRPIAIEKQTFKDFLDMGMGQETGIIIEKFIH